MELKKPDVNAERLSAIGCIVSNEFISEFKQICKLQLFQSKYAKTVVDWCISYHDNYEIAPKENISDIFESKKDTIDDTTADLIDEFLSSISREYNRDKFNYRFALDEAENYLKKRSLRSLSQTISNLVEDGEVIEAEAEIANFYNISKPETKSIDLLKDIDKVKEILTQPEKDELFHWKGKLGEFVDPCCRDELIAFFAPEKRGKSWWLQEAAMTALTKNNNVVFISLEMNEKKMITRFSQYLTGMPAKKKDIGCSIPSLSEKEEIKYKKSTKPLLTPNTTLSKFKAFKQLARSSTLKLLCWPEDSKTINDIKFQLDIWRRHEDFIPDVIIIDYADLLVAEDRRLEFRHQIDSIWKNMKRLAQERHCSVITASQTVKDTQEKTIKKTSTSEDKRKTSHPDRILALNQTTDDKKRMTMSVSILFDRHDSEKSWRSVSVLQQLAIGKPYLGSWIQTREEN